MWSGVGVRVCNSSCRSTSLVGTAVGGWLCNPKFYFYTAETDSPFLCRTSTLNEELGQVEYVLTDKTGEQHLSGVSQHAYKP